MTKNVLKFSELPNSIRIKLSNSGKKEFWHRIDEFGGIKNFCEAFEYSSSTVYNWKNKDSFIPVELIRSVFGNEATDEVTALKGEGRSRSVKNPELPLSVNDELMTRVQTSVNVNSNKIPVYQSSDQGNVRRFAELLNHLGDVPFEVYNRSVYELRYPKYLHQIFLEINYDEDFGALVDEKGNVKSGKLVFNDKEISFEEFNGQLHSRQKKYELYLARGDSDKLGKLISEETSRIDSLIKN